MLKCTLNHQCFTILFTIRQLISVYYGMHIQNWCTTEYSPTLWTCNNFIRVTTSLMIYRLIISDSETVSNPVLVSKHLTSKYRCY